MAKKTYIYALLDPRDGRTFYIGKSNNPKLRLLSHLEDGINPQKTAWIKELAEIGLTPNLSILKSVSMTEWQEAERSAILDAFSRGEPLTNIKPGGEGGCMPSEQWDKVMAKFLSKQDLKKFKGLSDKNKSLIGIRLAQTLARYWSIFWRGKAHTYEDVFMDKEAELGRRLARKLVNGTPN